MSALFLELARTVLFLSSSPHTFRLRMISSIVVLAPHGEVAKTLPVVGVELLATTLAGKHMATVLPNFVLARHLQRLECFVTDITGANPLSLLCFVTHTDPIKQHPDFPHKPALDTCRSRCQQMTTPLEVLLKEDPCLKGDVSDDKAGPLVCQQLNQISVLQCFVKTAGSMDHQHVLRQAVFFSSCHSTCTVLANREGWRVAGDLVPQEAPDHS